MQDEESLDDFVIVEDQENEEPSIIITFLYPNQKVTLFDEKKSKLLISLSPIIRENVNQKQMQFSFNEELKLIVPINFWDSLILVFEKFISRLELQDELVKELEPLKNILFSYPQEFFGLVVILDELKMDSQVESCTKLFCGVIDMEDRGPDSIRNKFEIKKSFFDERVEKQVQREINCGAWNKAKRENFFAGLVSNKLFKDNVNVSILVDNREIKKSIQENQTDSNIQIIDDHLFSHLRSRKHVAESKNNLNADKCDICSDPFVGYFPNKSTCRICGSAICEKCRYNLKVPGNLKSFQPVNGYLGYFRFIYRKGEPVCFNCSQILIIARAFAIMGLIVPQLEKVATVNLCWREAAIDCLSTLRMIQYHLPTKKLSQQEKKLLWNNRKLWIAHDKWLVQFIKAVNWEDKDQKEEAINILHETSPTAICFEAMCTRNCSKTNKLEPQRALELLNDTITHEYPREYAIKSLQSSPISELLCYLPVFIHDMRYESVTKSPIFDFLLETSSKDKKFCVELFWGLSLASEDKDLKYLYEHYKYKLTHAFNNDQKEVLRGLELMDTLTKYNKNPNILKQSSLEGIILPIKPNLKIIKIHDKQIQRMSSKTKPTVFPCECTDINTNKIVEFKFMLKPEDLRKDQIAINIIRRAHDILKNKGIDIPSITYNILPTSSNCGLLEYISEAETIKKILRNHQHLATYFKYSNPNEEEQVYNRFKNSAAFASVITYLLSVGDRHLDNIMVATTGEFFHIDFGFMAGEETYSLLKTLRTPIRIPPEMVTYLNCKDDGFKNFAKLCSEIYLILKKHYALFLNLLRLLPDARPKIEYSLDLERLESVIVEQFRPQESDVLSGEGIEEAVNHGEFIVDRITEVVRDPLFNK